VGPPAANNSMYPQLVKFSAKLPVVLLHLNMCIGMSALLHGVWFSTGGANQGSKVGMQLQLPWIFFLSSPFLLAAMWPNQIQLVVIKLPIWFGVEPPPLPRKSIVVII